MDEDIKYDLFMFTKDKKNTIYKFSYCLILMMIIGIVIMFTFDYQSYYQTQLEVIKEENDYKFKLLIRQKDLETITLHNKFILNNEVYTYTLLQIDENCLIDEFGECYRVVYIDTMINNDYLINNNVIDIKVESTKQKIYSYLLNF
ncbi:MAG: hypothetical protein Q4G04_04400 [bacterium]|nr:hypothetical protein [bacterium]